MIMKNHKSLIQKNDLSSQLLEERNRLDADRLQESQINDDVGVDGLQIVDPSSVMELSEEQKKKLQKLKEVSPTGYAAAVYALANGFSVIPVFHPNDSDDKSPPGRRGKRPIGPLVPNGCKNATNDLDVIIEWWNQKPNANIGIVSGPSDCLVLDIDGPEGQESLKKWEEELGPLPETWTVQTGREGGEHRYFKEPGFSVKNSTKWFPGIDIRHEGGYVVAPPSTHESGNQYKWIKSQGQVPCAPLPEKWIEKLPRKDEATPKMEKVKEIPDPQQVETLPSSLPPATPGVIKRCRQFVKECKSAVSGEGGHNQLYAVACVIFYDFGLSEEEDWEILTEYNDRCEPPWSDGELRHKVYDALRHQSPKPRGWRRKQKEKYKFEEGEFDPVAGRFVFNPTRPYPIAETIIQNKFTANGLRTMRYYSERFWIWEGNVYREVDDNTIKDIIHQFLNESITTKGDAFPAGEGLMRETFNTVLRRLALPNETRNNSWIGDDAPPLDSNHLIFGKSRIYDWHTGQFHDPDPRWFNRSCLSVDIDLNAPEPTRFNQFVEELFGDDLESFSLVCEYFGLLLTGNTSYQKMLLIIGPKRSGKRNKIGSSL